MLNIKKMCTIEERGLDEAISKQTAKKNVLLLFVLVVVGILANWFWGIGWEYLADPSKGLNLGPKLVIIVRVILSLLAAALTFIAAYEKINQNTKESWIPYFIAFQTGFFWDALFQSMAATFKQ